MRLDDSLGVGHRLVEDLQDLALGVLVVVEVRLSPVPVKLAVVVVPAHLSGAGHPGLARLDRPVGAPERVWIVRVRGEHVRRAEAVVDDDVAGEVVGVPDVREAVLGDVVPVVNLLGGSARHQHLHALEETSAGGEHVILVPLSVVGGLRRVSAAWDDADALDSLDETGALVENRRDHGVAELVAGEAVHRLVILVEQRLPETVRHPVHSLHHVHGLDDVGPAADGDGGRLVADVRELSAGETRKVLSELEGVNLGVHVSLGEVNLENLGARVEAGLGHGHLAIEPTGSHERGVQQIRAVGRAHKNHARVGRESVHLRQQLVQRLLVLLGALRARRRAPRAQRVDLVDEDKARGVHPRALEQIPDASRADADDDLDKLRARHGVERNLRLARDRLGDQGLAHAGPALHEQTLRRLGAQPLELLRVLEERDDLIEILDDVLQTADVFQRHLNLRVLPGVRPGLRELHRLDGVRRDRVLAFDAEVDGPGEEDEAPDG